MTPRPRHPCPDANQAEIIRQVERFGAVVCNVSALSVADAGCDLYVFDWSLETQQVEIHAFEVKMPGETLTANEREFWARVAALSADRQALGPGRLPAVSAPAPVCPTGRRPAGGCTHRQAQAGLPAQAGVLHRAERAEDVLRVFGRLG